MRILGEEKNLLSRYTAACRPGHSVPQRTMVIKNDAAELEQTAFQEVSTQWEPLGYLKFL